MTQSNIYLILHTRPGTTQAFHGCADTWLTSHSTRINIEYSVFNPKPFMIVILNLTETAQLNPDFSLSGHT